MINGQKMSFRYNMFIEQYWFKGWEVDFGKRVCMRQYMDIGQYAVIGCLVRFATLRV